VYKQILIDAEVKTGKRGQKQAYWEKFIKVVKVSIGP
jgi:hypothetical protein